MIRIDSFDNLKKDCWGYASKIHKSAKQLDGEEFWNSFNSIGKVNSANAIKVTTAYFEFLEKTKTQEQSKEIIEQAQIKFERK